MKKYINLEDRFCQQLEEFCKSNNIKVNDYIANSIKDKLYIDIYGDMNLMIKNKTVKKEEIVTPKKNITVEEKKDIVDIWSKIDEIIINKQVNQIIILDTEDNKHIYDINKLKVIEKEDKKEEIYSENIEEKPTRIKRTIKSK